MQVTAVLRRANRVRVPTGGFQLGGRVFFDRLNRHPDGWWRLTSKVTEELEPNIFRTEYGNIYRVETWAHPSKPTSEYDPLPTDWSAPPNKKL